MSTGTDLEKFREDWKKELLFSKKEEFIGKADREVSDDSAFHQTNSGDNDKHNSTVSKSVLDISVNNSIAYDIPSKAHISESVNIDENSKDCEDEDNNSNGAISTKVIDSDETHDHEYYPFKILTRFLNEAPKNVKTPRNKFDSKAHLSGITYSKRKYFTNAQTIGSSSKRIRGLKNELNSKQEGRFLDIFIADLDEINEIPFFDTSLPREVALKIFKHFDLKTLCRCSQVSRSWRSLADDELLWYHICQDLGFEKNLQITDDWNWKAIVRQHFENRRLQLANWKARIGKPYHLSFPRGGILCAVHSHDATIVAGYTSCQVRSWNTKTGDECTFSASNTALILDEQAEELGRIHNEIKHVRTTAGITAASFKHGFVDVWKNDGGMEPVHTMRFNSSDISSLSTLDINQQFSLVAAAQGTRVQIADVGTVEVKKLDFDMMSQVAAVDWLSNYHSTQSMGFLLMTCNNTVYLKKIILDSERITETQPQEMTEVHNIIWAPITCVGCRKDDNDIAVGYSVYTPSTQVKLNVYDLSINQLKATLTGHTWLISCVHLPPSLPHQLVSGSADRKIRQYDLRAGNSASITLIGHAAKVATVQMDDWKIVSGDDGGFVYVWDQRMCRKLWDVYNRHPVGYCHFDDRLLIIGNVPCQKFPQHDEFETVSSLRYRGSVQVYDFMANQQTQGVPDICLSSYSEPEASDYNIDLAVPYDTLTD